MAMDGNGMGTMAISTGMSGMMYAPLVLAMVMMVMVECYALLTC